MVQAKPPGKGICFIPAREPTSILFILPKGRDRWAIAIWVKFSFDRFQCMCPPPDEWQNNRHPPRPGDTQETFSPVVGKNKTRRIKVQIFLTVCGRWSETNRNRPFAGVQNWRHGACWKQTTCHLLIDASAFFVFCVITTSTAGLTFWLHHLIFPMHSDIPTRLLKWPTPVLYRFIHIVAALVSSWSENIEHVVRKSEKAPFFSGRSWMLNKQENWTGCRCIFLGQGGLMSRINWSGSCLTSTVTVPSAVPVNSLWSQRLSCDVIGPPNWVFFGTWWFLYSNLISRIHRLRKANRRAVFFSPLEVFGGKKKN